MRGVVDIKRFTAAVARGDALDLEREDIRDRGRALEPLDVNLDRLEFDPAEVSNEVLTDECRRAAGVAPDDGGKRGSLRIIRAVVDHAREKPVARGPDSGRAEYQC